MVNALAEKLFGYSRDDLFGKPIEIIVPEHLRDAHRRHRARYAHKPHARPMGAGVELPALRRDGSQFPAEISLGPLETEEGVLVLCAVRDVTERQRNQEALRKSQERFELAVRAGGAGIWDWDLRTQEIYISPHWMEMLGFEGGEPGDALREWADRLHPEDRQRALMKMQDYLQGKSVEYELEHRLRHRDGSYRWIFARGASIRDETGKLNRMVGSYIDITQRKEMQRRLHGQESELHAAKRIQEHLLPKEPLSVPGIDISAVAYPAEYAAGDHYDYFTMPDGSIWVVISDVSGHGFSSALLVAFTHAYLHSLTDMDLGIGDVLSRVHSALLRETEEHRYVTLLLGRLDPRTCNFTYASAGHPPGYVIDAAGNVKARLEHTSTPLGALPDAEFPLGTPLTLEPGDVVLLLTDGIIEAQSPAGGQFGEERVLRTVAESRFMPAGEIVEALHAAVREFTEGAALEDDVTVLVVKCQAGAGSTEGGRESDGSASRSSTDSAASARAVRANPGGDP